MVWRVRHALDFFTSGVTFSSPARASTTMPADKAPILSRQHDPVRVGETVALG